MLLRIIFGLFFFISHVSIAQEIIKHEYIFHSDKLNIVISAKSNKIGINDSLRVHIEILNIGKDTIYFFEEKELSSLIQKDSDVLYINYGEHFDSSIEGEITMFKLPSNKKKTLNIKIPYKKLIENLRYKRVFVEFGIGYIPNVEEIKKYEHLGTVKTQDLDDKIILSSIVISVSLTTFNVGGLKFYLN